MRRQTRIHLAIMGLALAALACNAVAGIGGTPTPTSPAGTEVPIIPETGAVLLSDDFSSAVWGTGTDSDSSVEYANDALQMIVYSQNYFVWSTPDAKEYQNLHAEVTVINNGTDATTAFGIMCHQQEVEDNFYYVAMTPAGQYAIAKASEGQKDVFLTNEDAWGASDLIPQDAPTYRVGADCGNGTITLYVDGQQVASIFDTSYTAGGVALFTWSGEEATTTDVSFDDFLMTQLP